MENTETNENELAFLENASPELLEYIEFLEEELESALEKVTDGRNAISTFVDLLAFIKENFGNTADYPVRIDNDFYKDVFLKKLTECEENVHKFSSGAPLDLSEDEIF
jgi:hypothetical protein